MPEVRAKPGLEDLVRRSYSAWWSAYHLGLWRRMAERERLAFADREARRVIKENER